MNAIDEAGPGVTALCRGAVIPGLQFSVRDTLSRGRRRRGPSSGGKSTTRVARIFFSTLIRFTLTPIRFITPTRLIHQNKKNISH